MSNKKQRTAVANAIDGIVAPLEAMTDNEIAARAAQRLRNLAKAYANEIVFAQEVEYVTRDICNQCEGDPSSKTAEQARAKLLELTEE